LTIYSKVEKSLEMEYDHNEIYLVFWKAVNRSSTTNIGDSGKSSRSWSLNFQICFNSNSSEDLKTWIKERLSKANKSNGKVLIQILLYSYFLFNKVSSARS